MKKVKVGIVGGSGYTGIELLRLLAQHPHAEIVTITGRKDAGTHVAKMFPSLRGRVDLVFEDPLPHLWINVMSSSLRRRTALR